VDLSAFLKPLLDNAGPNPKAKSRKLPPMHISSSSSPSAVAPESVAVPFGSTDEWAAPDGSAAAGPSSAPVAVPFGSTGEEEVPPVAPDVLRLRGGGGGDEYKVTVLLPDGNNVVLTSDRPFTVYRLKDQLMAEQWVPYSCRWFHDIVIKTVDGHVIDNRWSFRDLEVTVKCEFSSSWFPNPTPKPVAVPFGSTGKGVGKGADAEYKVTVLLPNDTHVHLGSAEPMTVREIKDHLIAEKHVNGEVVLKNGNDDVFHNKRTFTERDVIVRCCPRGFNHPDVNPDASTWVGPFVPDPTPEPVAAPFGSTGKGVGKGADAPSRIVLCTDEEYRACFRCGCYEPFQDLTDECCFAETGKKCIFLRPPVDKFVCGTCLKLCKICDDLCLVRDGKPRCKSCTLPMECYTCKGAVTQQNFGCTAGGGTAYCATCDPFSKVPDSPPDSAAVPFGSTEKGGGKGVAASSGPKPVAVPFGSTGKGTEEEEAGSEWSASTDHEAACAADPLHHIFRGFVREHLVLLSEIEAMLTNKASMRCGAGQSLAIEIIHKIETYSKFAGGQGTGSASSASAGHPLDSDFAGFARDNLGLLFEIEGMLRDRTELEMADAHFLAIDIVNLAEKYDFGQAEPTMEFAGVKKTILKKPSEQIVTLQKKLKKALRKSMGMDEDEDVMPDTIPRIIEPVIRQLRDQIAQHRAKHNAGENLITNAIKRLTEPQLQELSLLVAKGKHTIYQHERILEIAHVISPELMLIDDCMTCLQTAKADTMDLIVEAFTAHYLTEKMTINGQQLEKDVNEQVGIMKGVRLMASQGSHDDLVPPSTDAGDRCNVQ
jgi:hypothetical protein